ncbi:LysR family transcriptional regulator [Undibacterium sp. RuRC25W]|uniref:LysR family transcriptional regulator n=1 Tax=Undibacterium sp. RuRC25W TaxID=3413047 RepID=UPI003BF20F38
MKNGTIPVKLTKGLVTMDKLIAMRVFNEVVKFGSFARAAEHLDMAASVVTRHIAALETELGSQLLLRTTRSLSLTERGEIYLERSRQILEDIEQTEAMVSSANKAHSGPIKLAVTTNFGLHFMPAIMRRYQEIYPDILFDVMVLDEPVDLVARGLDLAITFTGSVLNIDTVTRSLASNKMILCATPDYLRQAPPLNDINDLIHHRCIALSTYTGTNDCWELRDTDGNGYQVPIKPGIICNTAAMTYQCVLADLGIARFTSVLAQHLLNSGHLTRVLENYEAPGLELVVAYPSRRYLTTKARSFIDFLISHMGSNQLVSGMFSARL